MIAYDIVYYTTSWGYVMCVELSTLSIQHMCTTRGRATSRFTVVSSHVYIVRCGTQQSYYTMHDVLGTCTLNMYDVHSTRYIVHIYTCTSQSTCLHVQVLCTYVLCTRYIVRRMWYVYMCTSVLRAVALSLCM